MMFRWGVSARIRRSISPICEMGLIVLIAIGLLSCAFTIYCLARCVKEGTDRPTTRYRPLGAAALLQRNLLIYGVGGIIAPFIGIKLIDVFLTYVGLA